MAKNILDTDYSRIKQLNEDNSLEEIEVERGIGSYFPIFISLGITLYGMYLFLSTITPNTNIIYSTLAFMGILILFIEAHRTDLLKDYLSSKLSKEIHTELKISNFALFMSGVITMLFISLDLWGALQSSDKIERLLVVGIVENSKEYKILDDKAKSGVEANKIYSERLALYNKAKKEHYKDCNKRWKLPKYRTHNASCKDKFKQVPPNQSDIKVSTSISSEDYKALSNKAKLTIQGYRDIFFYVFFGFSLLLNYFAVSTLINQYRYKLKELTEDVSQELLHRYELLHNEKINKLKESTKIQQEKTHEKSMIDVMMESLIYDIRLAKDYKALESMKQIPIAITSNEYANNRGGFIDLSKNIDQSVNDQSVPNRLDTSLFSEDENKLISLLYRSVSTDNTLLTPRTELHKLLGNSRATNEALRHLYKKLVKYGYAEQKKGVGYIAKVIL